MAHRSRLGGFIIDCKTDDLDAAGRFWGAALGMGPGPGGEPGHPDYRGFAREPDGLNIEVQTVEHESRIHLDIETDDIAAEVARLEHLGARRVRAVRDWVVMEAPTGQRFCVVPAFRADFARQAKLWE
ncbi:MAG TPA: VOC family protein [Candidatus Cybelea sp.]|nr:VOC family protein [Candidatus Cybelea sp.]